MLYPIYQEILYQHPVELFELFAEQPNAIFLDSAYLMQNCGRYSFIAVDPFLTMQSKNGEIQINEEIFHENPFNILSKLLKQYPLLFHTDLPPFQGGIAGFFSYDLYQHLEKISSDQIDDLQFPDLVLGFYDLVIAFDQTLQKAWIFSSGYGRQGYWEKRAKERMKWLKEYVNSAQNKEFKCYQPVKNIFSNFTRKQYCEAVNKVKNYILAGDIFEANISQRFLATLENLDVFSLYKMLREKNPATFSAFLNFKNIVIASSSPERFIKLNQNKVEARPIKGTRPRGRNEKEDKEFADNLLNSEKDHAENIMIVDLLRNDLSRVSEDHSIKVTQLCGLESYKNVHHLVSVITGKLLSDLNAIDLLKATFPGGSITGAPKIRAMEIIAEIEPTCRGPYCGSIGYIGFNGDMDLSIAIRTFVIKDKKITFQAGGAVVLDSHPETEYEETLTKSSALRKVLLNDFVN